MTTTDISTSDSNELDTSQLTYDELLALESYRVLGFAITEKVELLGVPLIITKATFWMPPKDQLGMVSCEAVIGSEASLAMAVSRGWIPNVESMGALKLKPSERIVFNDGSTGIRRQLVSLFHDRGLIDVGPMKPEEQQSGRGFDRAWPDWKSFSQHTRQSEEVGNVPSISRDHSGRPLVIRCDRGLSVSQYSNDYAKEAETFYLR